MNDRVALADLPGHTVFDGGRLNKDWTTTWGPLVKAFLRTFAPPVGPASPPDAAAQDASPSPRPELHGVLFLCDVRWPVQPEERELLRYCRDDLQLPVLLVLTKDDLVGTALSAGASWNALPAGMRVGHPPCVCVSV